MKSFRDIRVIPVVLVAVFGLAVLKVAGLVIDGGYVFDYDPQSTKRSWAQETLNFPGGPKGDIKGEQAGLKGDPPDITGSVPEKPNEPPPKPAPPPPAPPQPHAPASHPNP